MGMLTKMPGFSTSSMALYSWNADAWKSRNYYCSLILRLNNSEFAATHYSCDCKT